MSGDVDVLAPYRAGTPAPELPLRCSICHRRISDVTMLAGQMKLRRAIMRPGIPQGRPPSRRHATFTPGFGDGKPGRRPSKGWVFVSPERDRWRIWCEHKQARRGPLDRTVTASTLERLYAAALTDGKREIVLT